MSVIGAKRPVQDWRGLEIGGNMHERSGHWAVSQDVGVELCRCVVESKQ